MPETKEQIKERKRLEREAVAQQREEKKLQEAAVLKQIEEQAAKRKEFEDITEYEELVARHSKAVYDKMYYYLESLKLTPAFEAAAQEAMNRKAQYQAAGQVPSPEVKLEEVADAINTGTVDEWVKQNSTDGKETLADLLKDSE